MLVKISVEGEPRNILFMGTENRLGLFFIQGWVVQKLSENRLIIEEVSEDEAEQTMRIMREFSTGKLTEGGQRPWST